MLDSVVDVQVQERDPSQSGLLPDKEDPKHGMGSGLKELKASGIKWILSSRVEREDDDAISRTLLIIDKNPYPVPEELAQKYTALYFAHFHHRWTIIHAPTYEADGLTVLTSSIAMIGAWLDGTPESKESAIKMHNNLTDQISERLVS